MRVKWLAAVTERYRIIREEQSASSRIFLRFRCSARSRLFRRAVYARFCTPCFCPRRFISDALRIMGKAGTKRWPLARLRGSLVWQQAVLRNSRRERAGGKHKMLRSPCGGCVCVYRCTGLSTAGLPNGAGRLPTRAGSPCFFANRRYFRRVGFIADSRGCDVLERFCKLDVLCSKFCVIFFIRKWGKRPLFYSAFATQIQRLPALYVFFLVAIHIKIVFRPPIANPIALCYNAI